MKPAKLDLPTIWRGCNYPAVQVAWTDGNDDPINLTGWRPHAYSRDFQFDARVTNYRGGLTAISLPASVTETLKLGVKDWDFLWVKTTPPNTVSKPFMHGKVEVKEPVSDPLTPVMGRIGGGANYVKQFPETQTGYTFINLVGHYHQDWPPPDLSPDNPYPPPRPPPVSISATARTQMADMRANGHTKITIVIAYQHAYLDITSIAERVQWEYCRGYWLIPWQPRGIENDPNVQLTAQQTQNLIDLIRDIRAAGFTQLHIRFSDVQRANPYHWPDLNDPKHPESGIHEWIPVRYEHNRNYIFYAIGVIEANREDLTVVYDLGLEHGNSLFEKDTGLDANEVHRQYGRFLWHAFTDAFTANHSMAFSMLPQYKQNTPGLRYSKGFAAFLELIRGVGLPFPGYYGFDLYGDVDTEPDLVYNALTENYDYLKIHYEGQETKPFVIQETFYDDGIVALQIERALFARRIDINSFFQWPGIRGHSRPNYIFPDGYPWRFDAYRTL